MRASARESEQNELSPHFRCPAFDAVSTQPEMFGASLKSGCLSFQKKARTEKHLFCVLLRGLETGLDFSRPKRLPLLRNVRCSVKLQPIVQTHQRSR